MKTSLLTGRNHVSLVWVVALFFVGFVLMTAGCQTQGDLEYGFQEKLSELPEKHQSQIKMHLEKYFGTATRPRMMAPAPEDEQGAEGDDDAANDPATAGEGSAADGAAGATSGDTYPVALVDTVDRSRLAHGQDVYQQRCAACHGVTGDGNGVAAEYLDPKPRDYRRGIFKFSSTGRAGKPLRSDLKRIIMRGAKGTSMPNFRWLPDEDMEPLIDYVTLLSKRGELELKLIDEADFELEPEDDMDPEIVAEYASDINDNWATARETLVLPVSPMPPFNEESIALGQQAFISKGCSKCHGEDGRGHTQENVGKDDWGNTTFAADLTSGMLHGGRRYIDVYRRIAAGINGTPMPAFGDTFKDEPDTIWHLTHFVIGIVDHKVDTQKLHRDAEARSAAKEAAAGDEAAGDEAAGDEAAGASDAATNNGDVRDATATEAGDSNTGASVDIDDTSASVADSDGESADGAGSVSAEDGESSGGDSVDPASGVAEPEVQDAGDASGQEEEAAELQGAGSQ
ncbi:MAG: c-type cytochrome [Pirellulaceae bacterium]